MHGNTTVSSGGTFEFIGVNASGFGVTALSGATLELGSGASRTATYVLSTGVTGICYRVARIRRHDPFCATGIVENGGSASDYTVSSGEHFSSPLDGTALSATISGGKEQVRHSEPNQGR